MLGSVFLVVTGGEALYADMGHFGRGPIRSRLVRGRAAALSSTTSARARCCSRDPEAPRNPFYLLAPRWALYPLVVLATLAAVIASQALISGAFSLTRQAMQLGYSPRLRHRAHVAAREGQIYIRRSTGC